MTWSPSARRMALDEAERAVRWLVWPANDVRKPRVYGPGLTSAEVVERHDRFLRSGWSRAGSGAYHNIRCAPETEPPAPWREAYPDGVVGRDPWRCSHATCVLEVLFRAGRISLDDVRAAYMAWEDSRHEDDRGNGREIAAGKRLFLCLGCLHMRPDKGA